jgi:hypothetical protein
VIKGGGSVRSNEDMFCNETGVKGLTSSRNYEPTM